MAFCFVVFTLLTPFGCESAEGAGQGSASISGPLTMLPQYQSRAPRTCSAVKSPPSVSVATVLVQCTMEADSLFGVGLVQDIKLEIGKSSTFGLIAAYNKGVPLVIEAVADVYDTKAPIAGCTGVPAV